MGNLNVLINRLRAKSQKLSHEENSATVDKLLAFYTRFMTKVTDAERCSIFIHDPQNDKVWLKTGTGVGEHEIEVPKKSSVAGQVITSGEPMIVSDLDPKSDASKLVLDKTGFETRNILCVPIKSATRNEVTGAFQLLNKKNAETFNEEDMADALEIAEHMQDQVDSVFLKQEIHAISDKLYNTAEKTISYLVGAIGILIFVIAFVIFGSHLF